MRKVFDTVRGVGVLVVLALVIAGCGGTDVHVGDGTGVNPSRGLFDGQTAAGGSIVIEVGTIEAVTFECDGTEVQHIFAPPGDVDVDGSFDLRFNASGRKFRFKGQFTSDNFVEGSIDDGDDACDVVFSACRKTPVNTCGASTPGATPTRTPTPNAATTTNAAATTTQTPPLTPTPVIVPTGPTQTPEPGATPTRTATPTAAPPQATKTRTPTPAPTATPFCGNGVKDAGEDCDTAANFGASNGDCADQCTCCYCRPNIGSHDGPNMSSCSGCHGMGALAPGLGPKPPKPGAVATFGAKCN